ncbi:MAG: hypothetical protein J1F23_06380 [Oscillospiraceae bacterium]|nr:hypothetical protein [Oscillospiraceae bacterium]
MERKTISIDISPDTLDEAYREKAGVMWEHNAVSITFNIDSRFVGDYRYYIEYRSFLGTLVRTVNLTLNKADNTVTYAIPAGMSSLMSVECFFNIVSVDGDGNTLQIIKPKRFCLDFDRAPDTDNTLSKINDFTVNSLLEAIRNGTFKGEKGDKGDSYVLTDDDRADIALRINGDIYGLPYIREFESSDKTPIKAVSSNGTVKKFTIRPATSDLSAASEDEPVPYTSFSKIKLFIGKNEIEYLLDPDMYSTFKYYSDACPTVNYRAVPISLKPNTKYALVRYSADLNNSASCIINSGATRHFAHKSNAGVQIDYMEINTDESGLIYISTTGLAASNAYDEYRKMLACSFYGLGIYELPKSMIISVEVSNNLCAIADNTADTAEMTSGKVTYNIEQFAVPKKFSEDAVRSFKSADATVYRYNLPLTVTPDCRNDYDIVSTHYKQTESFVDSDSDLSEPVASEEGYKGIYLDRVNAKIYLYTDKDPEAFAEFITKQQAAGTPVTVLYRMKYPLDESITPTEITLNKENEYIHGFPQEAVYSVSVNGDISAALNEVMNKI